jgi:hypothetical protein
MVSVSGLQRLAARQTALAGAEVALTDLDMQESNSTIALNRALLATSDADRRQADGLVAAAATAAGADLGRIQGFDLPTSASAPLATATTACPVDRGASAGRDRMEARPHRPLRAVRTPRPDDRHRRRRR